MMRTKVCFKCGQQKGMVDFYRHSQMADGHLNKCKECTKRDVSKNYVSKRKQYSDYERERNKRPERKAKQAEYLKRRRLREPEKDKARRRVAYAVQTGQIKRMPCESCGSMRVQAHHYDYSKPLDIKWLCFTCHRAEHGQEVTSPGGERSGLVEAAE